MVMTRARGLTMIEILTTLAVTAVILAGIFMTFNKMNVGIKNAMRSNDLVYNVRGLYQMMQADLATAGRGVSDVNTLQIHFAHDEAVAGEEFFYGVVSRPQLNGHSQVIFQWFDYDVTRNPTYPVINPDAAAFDTDGSWLATPTSVELHSNDPTDPEIANIAPGDIFLIYNPSINYDRDLHEQIHSSVNGDFSWQEEVLGNGALILEATNVIPDLANNRVTLQFDNRATTFDNTPTLPRNPQVSNYSDVNQLVSDMVREGLARFAFKPPPSVWLARKLSSVNGFHRVRYWVNSSDALIRSETVNGTVVDLVLATNVSEFNFKIGLDIDDPLNPANQEPAAWNSSVSYSDGAAFWPEEGTSASDIILIGRHALAAKMKLTLRSQTQDLLDNQAGDDGGTHRTMHFERQFQIRNLHRPYLNY